MSCPSGKQYYVCAKGDFQGCCTVDPCTSGVCPDGGDDDADDGADDNGDGKSQIYSDGACMHAGADVSKIFLRRLSMRVLRR